MADPPRKPTDDIELELEAPEVAGGGKVAGGGGGGGEGDPFNPFGPAGEDEALELAFDPRAGHEAPKHATGVTGEAPIQPLATGPIRPMATGPMPRESAPGIDLELRGADTSAELELATRRPRLSGEIDPPSARARLLVMLALVGVFVLVGLEVAASMIQHSTPATERDFESARVFVSAKRKAGEPVLFAPYWMAPIGRQHFAQMLSLRLSSLSDVDAFARVWVVSVRGERHPWLRGKSPKVTRRFGGVTVARYDQKPADVLYDFFDHLGDASVQLVSGRIHNCGKRADRLGGMPSVRFDCGRSWNRVAQYLAEVDHKPYRCIYAHAVDRKVKRITFPDVPLGARIVLYTGINDFEKRKLKNAGAPVTVAVYAGSQRLGQVEHQNDWPWHRTVVSTKAHAGKRAPVRFEITTRKAFGRELCFYAESQR
ncbi:MAG: hypothetical protein KC503_38115 [Myxococcales bacterium]|nr:hypothetical protein [Myxococcales bacterium]